MNRRTLLTAILLGGAGGVGGASLLFSDVLQSKPDWETLDQVPVSFREWDLLAVDAHNSRLLAIDPLEEALLASWEVSGTPSGILHSGNGLAVVVDAANRTLTLFRQGKRFERLQVSLPLTPSIVALAPGGRMMAVLDRETGDLAFVSTQAGGILSHKAGLDGAYGLMFDKYGDTLYVARHSSGSVDRVDAKTYRSLDPFQIDGVVGLETLLPIQGEDWMVALPAADGDPAFHILDFDGTVVRHSIPIPSHASRIVYDTVRNRVLAAATNKAEFYSQSLFASQQVTVATEFVTADMAVSSADSTLSVISHHEPAVRVYDALSYAPVRVHRLSSLPESMIYHFWSEKVLVAQQGRDAVWLRDKHSAVREVPLNGASPTLFAAAGSAICHA